MVLWRIKAFLIYTSSGQSRPSWRQTGNTVVIATAYYFYPPMDNGYPFHFDYRGNGPEWTYEDALCGISFRNGTWKQHTSIRDTGTVIQESEAKAIIDQYPEKELDWQPVWDYPVDENGRTLGDELSSRTLPQSDAEYLAFYADAAEQGDIWFLNHYTHFALYDLNQDQAHSFLFQLQRNFHTADDQRFHVIQGNGD